MVNAKRATGDSIKLQVSSPSHPATSPSVGVRGGSEKTDATVSDSSNLSVKDGLSDDENPTDQNIFDSFEIINSEAMLEATPVLAPPVVSISYRENYLDHAFGRKKKFDLPTVTEKPTDVINIESTAKAAEVAAEPTPSSLPKRNAEINRGALRS